VSISDIELLGAEGSNVLLELSRTVTSSLDLQEVLDKSLAALRRLIDFGGGAIQLVQDGYLVAAATDPPATDDAMTVQIPVGHGVSGRIAATCEAIYIPDILADVRVDSQRRGVSGGVRTYFGAPLIVQGEAIGVAQIDAPDVDAFSPGARATMLAFMPTIAAAVQNALLFKRETETIRKLREAERIKDDFLAIASHELRTPLTSLTGFSATLAQQVGTLPPDVVSDFASRILRASHQLERLVADLLDVARIEHGILNAEPCPYEIEPIIREAMSASSADDGPLTLSVEPGLPAALVNPSRMRQILLNLISNARKFSAADSPVEIRAFRQGAMIGVSVTDHGVGIEADNLERIFDRFFQIDPALTRRAGGLGVGLYLVKKLAELMDASVGVSSTPGSGSTFTVYLRSARS
jgi:signal transduction histidine kinase